MEQYLQVSKGKQFQPRILYSAKLLVKYKSQRYFQTYKILIFASCVPFLRKILEGMILESESERKRERWNSEDRWSHSIPCMMVKEGLRLAAVSGEQQPSTLKEKDKGYLDALEHIQKICLV